MAFELNFFAIISHTLLVKERGLVTIRSLARVTDKPLLSIHGFSS